MKKNVCCFAVLLLSFSSPAPAQKLMLGVRGGLNLATEAVDTLATGSTLSRRALLAAGAQFDVWMTDMWALSVQALFDQKGTHEDFDTYDDAFHISGTDDVSIQYLEFPILGKAAFGSGNVHAYFFAGPSIAFLLSGQQKFHTTFTHGANTRTTDTTINLTDSLAGIDVALMGGVGLSL